MKNKRKFESLNEKIKKKGLDKKGGKERLKNLKEQNKKFNKEGFIIRGEQYLETLSKMRGDTYD